MGSILCVWCDGPSVGCTTGYGYREKNQTNQQSVYNLIKAMAEYNPDYFTGKVKLSGCLRCGDWRQGPEGNGGSEENYF